MIVATAMLSGLAHQWFEGCEYVNPDVIAQKELGDWNDPKAVLQAAQIATERCEASLRERRRGPSRAPALPVRQLCRPTRSSARAAREHGHHCTPVRLGALLDGAHHRRAFAGATLVKRHTWKKNGGGNDDRT